MSGPVQSLGGANQQAQRVLRPVPQLPTEQPLKESSPPPGREMEVSIEANPRAPIV
ncbi:MAG: hypothetical protein JOZ65_31970 [Chloroflexi bacterium]|nr:hypothetical protein [Chloroflexota bacterium]